MSDPSPVRLSIRLALVSTWCACGAIVTAVASENETIQLKVMSSLGLASPSLALLTLWLRTVVVQGAIWWVTVAVRERADTPSDIHSR